MFNIDNHEKDILAVGYKNKTIQTQDKWNQLNIMDIQYLLGTNHCLPLSYMATKKKPIDDEQYKKKKSDDS